MKAIQINWRRYLVMALLATCLLWQSPGGAAERITLSMRDASLSNVMNMLARQNRVNILLADNVDGQVSFSLYDVSLDDAIRSIAQAAGYAVERRNKTYFILPENRAGKLPDSGFTIVKSLPVQYADPAQLETKLADYLSDFGNITAVPERKLLVVEDQPGFVWRISRLVNELDQRPPQVLIEAKILEIKLNDEQSFGIDWEGLFTTSDGDGDFGVQGLLAPGNSGNAGFFFNYLEPKIELALRALESDGRVRNLASPKVVTVVNQEAEVIIGDRRGYRVTTTINQVTTESIEFLESGTILRVTPTIDQGGKIMLDIHPEVSTGTVDENGIPSQTTTEVTTRLLVASGQSIFIGGLMRNTTTEGRSGVPVLGRVPGVRWLFSSKTRTTVNTETVVVITPRLLDDSFGQYSQAADREVDAVQQAMLEHAKAVDEAMEDTFSDRRPHGQSEAETAPLEDTADRPREQQDEQLQTKEAVPSVPEPAAAIEREGTGQDAGDAGATARPAEGAATPSVEPMPATEQASKPRDATASPASAAGRYAVNLHSDLAPVELPGLPLAPGQRLYLAETELDGQTWHRLRLGFFATEAEARAVMAQWQDRYPAAWVVRVGPQERRRAAANAGAAAEAVAVRSD